MAHYFAYGSNLSVLQMQRRCLDVRPAGPAALADHRLVFAGASKRWSDAGVATIVPAPHLLVRGLLYELDDLALERLDRFEGSYTRQRVTLDTGEAWTYVRRSSIPRRRPSPDYIAIMAHAYGELGYPLNDLLDALSA